MPVGSTSQPSVQELGLADNRLLTPLRRLYPLPVRQASVLPTASFGFRLATDTLAVRLTLPLAGRVEDFHLQVSAPCRAHNEKSLREWAKAWSGKCGRLAPAGVWQTWSNAPTLARCARKMWATAIPGSATKPVLRRGQACYFLPPLPGSLPQVVLGLHPGPELGCGP